MTSRLLCLFLAVHLTVGAPASALAASAITLPAASAVRQLVAASTCPPSIAAPVGATLELRGDSIFFGGSCSGATPVPAVYIDTALPGGTAAGWYVVNKAISGETPAQIRTRYVAEEATACFGERCKVLLLNGGTNGLRLGVTPVAALADILWVADDARAKGRLVVVMGVPPYAGFSGAGTDPLGQATTYNALLLDACNARAADKGFGCVFPYSTFVDPAQPGYLLPACTCDGVHFVKACQNQLSQLVLDKLTAMLAALAVR